MFVANEIAATAALRNVKGANSEVKARTMMRHAVVAYRYAARAVDCVIVTYL